MVAPNRVVQARLNLTNNTSTSLVPASGDARQRFYVQSVQLQNKHATVATTLRLLSGTDLLWEVNLPAAQAQPVAVPVTLVTGFNTVLNAQCGTTGSDVLVNVQGFYGS